MAGVKWDATSGEVNCVANTPKTVLQIKSAANQRSLIRMISAFGKAAAGGTDVPGKLSITKSSSSFGSSTSNTATISKVNESDSETLQTTATGNFTAEPTTPTDGGFNREVNPQTGFIEYFPSDAQKEIPGGHAWNVVLVFPANQIAVVTVSGEE